jgi:hypothetical protein
MIQLTVNEELEIFGEYHVLSDVEFADASLWRFTGQFVHMDDSQRQGNQVQGKRSKKLVVST